MDGLKKSGQQDRSKINMHEAHEVQYWSKHLNITKEEQQKAVDKVGNEPPPSASNSRCDHA